MSKSKRQKQHLERIANLPCVLCGDYGVQVHHIREGVGMGQRQSDFLTIPLCPPCHTGSTGVHGDKSMMRIHKESELSLLAKTIESLQLEAQ